MERSTMFALTPFPSMNMSSRNQYLTALLERRGYHLLSKKEKTALLDEYCQTTGQNRSYVIRKIRQGRYRTESFGKRKRRAYYDGAVRAALVTVWRLFDYPCGQRLESILRSEVDRLRTLRELRCTDTVAVKLKQIDASTIDRKLKHQREVEQRTQRSQKVHPLLYQKIPVKVFSEQDRSAFGTIQIDLVEHCGQSAAGEYAYTVSTTDISSGWWEGVAVLGRGQEGIWKALNEIRARYPFSWVEIHTDNDTAFINEHLYRYCQKEHIDFSRSRPYKKNDNALVEQKNGTHVRRLIGYLRYDTPEERDAINDLYGDLRLFKNFLQPVMKLVEKERVGGRLHPATMRRRRRTIGSSKTNGSPNP